MMHISSHYLALPLLAFWCTCGGSQPHAIFAIKDPSMRRKGWKRWKRFQNRRRKKRVQRQVAHLLIRRKTGPQNRSKPSAKPGRKREMVSMHLHTYTKSWGWWAFWAHLKVSIEHRQWVKHRREMHTVKTAMECALPKKWPKECKAELFLEYRWAKGAFQHLATAVFGENDESPTWPVPTVADMPLNDGRLRLRMWTTSGREWKSWSTKFWRKDKNTHTYTHTTSYNILETQKELKTNDEWSKWLELLHQRTTVSWNSTMTYHQMDLGESVSHVSLSHSKTAAFAWADRKSTSAKMTF